MLHLKQNINVMSGEEIIVSGFIVPVDWDRHGGVCMLSVITSSFEKYIISSNTKSEQLLKYIDRCVKIEGVVQGEDIIGNKIICINNYQLHDK